MRSNYIDDETTSLAYSALDAVRAYKLMYDRGLISDITCKIIADEDETFFLSYEILENYSDVMFDTDIEVYEVNFPGSEICEHFKATAESFVYEEATVTGVDIKDPAIRAFYELCDRNNIDIYKTKFARMIWDADGAIHDERTYESYLELFIPPTEELRKIYTLLLFYQDACLFNSFLLSGYYDALDWCRDIMNNQPIDLSKIMEE